MSSTSIHQLIKDEVKRQVPPAVKREMTPTFFESFFNQVIFDNQLNNAVINNMPDILRKNNSIVEQFVKGELPSALNNHYLVNQAMAQQSADFQARMASQQKIFRDAETNMVPRLRIATDSLIQNTVVDVANQQHVVQQMRTGIEQDLKCKLNSDVDQMNQRIENMESNMKWSYTISAGIGGVVGCVFTHVLSKL
jgi:hypothetical protein